MQPTVHDENRPPRTGLPGKTQAHQNDGPTHLSPGAQKLAAKPAWTRLGFDTQTLGATVARVDSSVQLADIAGVLEACQHAGVELVYWSQRTPVHEQASGELNDAFTGHLVSTSVSYRMPLANGERDCRAARKVRTRCVQSVVSVTHVTEDLLDLAFAAGVHSRFRRDACLSQTEFENMYGQWVRNSVARTVADEVLAVVDGERVKGFITVKADPVERTASIGLLAVAEDCRGQGVGSLLVDAVVEWCACRSATTLTVVTQAENEAAVAFYEAQGFREHDRKHDYHVWLQPNGRVPFNAIHTTGREVANLQCLVNDKQLASLGSYTVKCEQWMQDKMGCAMALLTHSATSALDQTAILADLGPGDEVIMPSYTFVSTASSVALRGATPVFVDICADTLNIDPARIEAAITPRTKAIYVVHYGGIVADMDVIMDIARQHDLVVVEDAAQAFMSKYKGRYAGTIGHMGVFSFHYTKNTVCGEGGALIVNDARLCSQARIVREKGTNRSDFLERKVTKYHWISLGSSYEPNELTAAFLLGQLDAAVDVSRRRRRICHAYRVLLQPLHDAGMVRTMQIDGDRRTRGNGHIYWVTFSSADARARAEAFLDRAGVQCFGHYLPLHLSPAGVKYGRADGCLDRTVDTAAQLLRLPVWPGMRWPHVERLVRALFSHFGMPPPPPAAVASLFAPGA